jgi:hypothetical protein
MAPPEDKRQAEDYMQRIANAFFFSVTIFALAFAYFVLSARAQDHHHRAMRNSMSLSTAVLSENFIRPAGPPVGRASSTFRWAPWSNWRPAADYRT